MGKAEMVLEPGAPAELESQAPAQNKVMGEIGPGEIGPPGTTSVRGRARFYLVLGGMIAVPFLLVFLALIVMVMLVG